MTGILFVFTPSLFKKFKMNSPTLSLPIPVSKLALIPRRAHPTEILRGEPPTKASKPFISLKSAPIS